MVTGLEIWTALQQDERFMSECPEGESRDILRAAIDKVPELLKEQLPKPVSIETIFESKAAFLSWFAESGELKRMIEAIPVSHLAAQGLGAEDAAELLKGMSETVTETVGAAVAALCETMQSLAQGSADERTFVEEAIKREMNGVARAEFAAGTLTIERVLLINPGLILRNQSS